MSSTEDFTTTFPTAFTPLAANAALKQSPADFIVNEVLSFPFSGEGEHLYLRVEKTGQNTQWLAGMLARHFAIKERDIGYAGLKDRQAITSQWFSLPASSVTERRLAGFELEGCRILGQHRHRGKLRKGAIRCNEFSVVLRNVDVDDMALQQQLEMIRQRGVPNYFDEQRFGRQRQNLFAAEQMFQQNKKMNRQRQGLIISAARSWLFNHVVAERVNQQVWDKGLSGDLFMLEGSQKYFHAEQIDAQIELRLQQADIHPSGPLYGESAAQTTDRAGRLEEMIRQQHAGWCQALAKRRVPSQRRATRVMPQNFQGVYDASQQTLKLSFSLPAGAYATNLLREIVTLNDGS